MSESVHDKNGNTVSASALMFSANTERATRQLEAPITVIIGNPPYSVGQKSANDNNQNVSYAHLDKSLANTYVVKSKATLKRNVYDTYIKAFRWATDRLGDNGVIGFVSNGAYLDSVALDGFRQCLLEDFNSVYVFNLRGNARTSGEQRRKEAGNVFAAGSRTPVSITILVKKKGVKKDGFVRYHDIGDYLTREQKLSIISEFESIKNVPWKILKPNENHDWINQRNSSFMNFVLLGDKKRNEALSIFGENFSNGLITSRDAWVYNFSAESAERSSSGLVNVYNQERTRCHTDYNRQLHESKIGTDPKVKEVYLTNCRNSDPQKISWSRGLSRMFYQDIELVPCQDVRRTMYRPFCKKNLVYDKDLIELPSKWDSIFPTNEAENIVIGIAAPPLKRRFSALITDCMQDYNIFEHTFCFPLYMYDKEETKSQGQQLNLYDLMAESADSPPRTKYKKRCAISDAALKKFREIYGNKVEKEEIFYYIYAVLQSKKYIELYEDNLSKEMPRIPMLDKFPEYVRIGRELAKLHLSYECKVDPAALGLSVKITKPDYTVKKMQFKKDGKNTLKDTIIFNEYITIGNIPERAYEYVVNGKSAIEWVMERYAVTTDAASKITDDPNLYGGEKYIFDLLISVIALSVKTQDLIDTLPEYKEI